MAVDFNQIVLGFRPSDKLKDWQCRADGDHNWFYEQRVRFDDPVCRETKAYCPKHRRDIGREPYYDMVVKAIVEPPRIYITHYPKKGEWEKLKTVQDLIASSLYKVGK